MVESYYVEIVLGSLGKVPTSMIAIIHDVSHNALQRFIFLEFEWNISSNSFVFGR